MNYKNVLITGGAGFIGRNLTQFLRQKNYHVTPLDNLAVIPTLPPPYGLWHADILDLSPLDLQGIDVVIHLAAHKSVPKSFTFHDEAIKNIAQDKHILRICAEAHIPKVIVASSCEVYGQQTTIRLCEESRHNPMSPYAVSKAALEMHTNIYRQLAPNTQFTCVRLFNIYGPDEGADAVVPRFIQDILSLGYLTVEGSGDQRRDFSYIDDIVRIFGELLPLSDLPNIINIGSGKSYRIKDLANLVLEKAGEGTIRFTQGRPNEIQSFCADTSLLETVLGYAPKHINFSQGVQYCIDALGEDSFLQKQIVSTI